MEKYELYEKLVNMNGIAGHESNIKRFVRSYLEQYSDEIVQDKLGGVFGIKKGNGPTIMFCGHMDEVGFMVVGITKQGMIELHPIGGINPEVYLSQNMEIVINENKTIKGIIGAIPPHLTRGREKKPISMDDLVLDIGADSKEHAIKMGVRIGQQVVSCNMFYETEDKKKLVSKAWDDRFGVGMCLEIMKELQNINHPNTVICGATVQEEVGLRGAVVASQMIQPDLFITIDVSPATDFMKEQGKSSCSLGKGFLVRFYDPKCIMSAPLHKYFLEISEEKNIPHQLFLSMGATDAANAQFAGKGIFSSTLGLPGRYIHTTASMIHVDDIKAVKDMALEIIKTFDNEKLKQLKEEL